MKPAPFEYVDPRSVDEVLAHLARCGDDAKILAGGQSLVPMLNFRLARPALIVDINRVDGLGALTQTDGALRVGALVRPGRVIGGLEPASVCRKLRDKAFARTVNRDDVYRGAEELGVDLDQHIAFVVAALTTVAPDIGLTDRPPS